MCTWPRAGTTLAQHATPKHLNAGQASHGLGEVAARNSISVGLHRRTIYPWSVQFRHATRSNVARLETVTFIVPINEEIQSALAALITSAFRDPLPTKHTQEVLPYVLRNKKLARAPLRTDTTRRLCHWCFATTWPRALRTNNAPRLCHWWFAAQGRRHTHQVCQDRDPRWCVQRYRLLSPQWGLIRFRPLICTHAHGAYVDIGRRKRERVPPTKRYRSSLGAGKHGARSRLGTR